LGKIREARAALIAECGGACVVCGYSNPVALEFHHVKKKRFKLSGRNLLKPRKEIEAELWRCVLLCCNCHKEAHAKDKKV
jgi:5-methylcytosine-specific restriction endonuclease McrA